MKVLMSCHSVVKTTHWNSKWVSVTHGSFVKNSSLIEKYEFYCEACGKVLPLKLEF